MMGKLEEFYQDPEQNNNKSDMLKVDIQESNDLEHTETEKKEEETREEKVKTETSEEEVKTETREVEEKVTEKEEEEAGDENYLFIMKERKKASKKAKVKKKSGSIKRKQTSKNEKK